MTVGPEAERLDALTLPLWGSRLIEASAGTGKTWTIAALYLRLVLGHGDDDAAFGPPLVPSQILVMTFTRAATRELADRIRTRLVDAARSFRGLRPVDADDALLRGLVASCPDDAAREHAAWRLAMAADGMDDAAVFTIDAWVQRMLREHAFDSGCLFDEEVLPDGTAMDAEAARDYWRQQVYPLDAGTLESVLSVWPKVEALVKDVRKLMPHVGVDPEPASLAEVWADACRERSDVLAALKAPWPARVREMRDWIHAQLASPAKPFDGKVLKGKLIDGWLDMVDRWARDPAEELLTLTPAARRKLSSEGLLAALVPGRTLAIPPSFDTVAPLLVAQKGIPKPGHAIRRHAAAQIAARVLVLKQRAGTYGFADMLARLDRALLGPSGERLRARIVAQYPVALIDEFQDTSALQYRIFDTLYRTAANDRDSALLLIGDPKQSIYGFRDADIRSYLRAREAMAGRHYFLTTNFRATVDLVGAVNHLFGRAEQHADGAFRFGAGAASALPFVPVAARGRRESFTCAAGPVPALTICHDAELSARPDALRRFAERCAAHIVDALGDPGTGFVDPVDGFTRLRPADITILVRDRNEAAAIRRALRVRHVPSAFLSDQDSVFASAEAGDLLHWLRAVAEPLDSRRARVAFATAFVGLTLAQMTRLATDDIAFERRLDDLKALHLEWRRQGVLPMLRRTLHLLELPARWLARPDGERRLTNVLHLAELLQQASAKLDGEQAVIRWLAEQLVREDRAGDDQVVRLESDAALIKVVTIHMAKGLEYAVVYLPFVCGYRAHRHEGIAVLPGADGEPAVIFDPDDADRARVELAAEQEDLRLLYVALTRARHALWLGVAPLKAGQSALCGFRHSAFGYLVCAGRAVAEHEIEARLHDAFDGVASVRLTLHEGPATHARLASSTVPAALVDAADYDARFERDWSIGSFSAFVRDLARGTVEPVGRSAVDAVMVDPAMEEELLSAAADDEVAATDAASSAARHRFPRGAAPGNFLHDQLEWLAAQRFALATDAAVREQLARRCERLGWGHRAADVATWLGEVVDTVLPPLGVALAGLERILPEMEFWFPSAGVGARRIDALCRRHLLDGRVRPALPDRMLRGMLMGFADLVCEVDGRYWVIDYKSNALGPGDAAYGHDALEASMAQHRYDVQAALYLLALHRLLRARLGARYDPARQLGGALYLFLRGVRGPVAGCYRVAADVDLLDALDTALSAEVTER